MILEAPRPNTMSIGTHRSSFKVSKAQFADIPKLVDIEFRAFRHELTNHILSYRDPNKQDHSDRAVRCYQKLFSMVGTPRRCVDAVLDRHADRRLQPTLVQFRKVMDTAKGQIISWAKTEYKTYSEKELVSPLDCGHEGEEDMNREWFAVNEKLRRDYVGTRRHCCE